MSTHLQFFLLLFHLCFLYLQLSTQSNALLPYIQASGKYNYDRSWCRCMSSCTDSGRFSVRHLCNKGCRRLARDSRDSRPILLKNGSSEY
ncbi:hypothetical protein DFH05DRAFT_1488469 [Lentinula detonsa]|uniref:Secreted protein n=1 Tax=Lentinula detonsa TaxID=2804962 RepID=A0A9W8P2I4_9AGAR|nr:hypothetical protein DFH05DRAFT_1488469 [Lentinula detonsa]